MEFLQELPNSVFLLLKDWIEQNQRPVADDGKGKPAKLFWLAAVMPSMKNATKGIYLYNVSLEQVKTNKKFLWNIFQNQAILYKNLHAAKCSRSITLLEYTE